MEKSSIKFIYGAGEFGKKLFHWLLDMGIEVDYFVQTDEPNGKDINGVPVISFKNFIDYDREENKVVLIAISNKKAISEIERNIVSAIHPGGGLLESIIAKAL